MPGCHETSIARGLCRRHYDGLAHAGRFRHRELPEEDFVGYCTCTHPRWRGCGPFFPTVRECTACGKPDRRQLGKPPPGTDSRWS